MWYNKTYALREPHVGQIVVSRMGHDAGRPYVIVAVLSSEFVLLADGKYRTVDKPKTKRTKHLRFGGESEAATRVATAPADAELRKVLKAWAKQTDPNIDN